jgi:hypothetical protein
MNRAAAAARMRQVRIVDIGSLCDYFSAKGVTDFDLSQMMVKFFGSRRWNLAG